MMLPRAGLTILIGLSAASAGCLMPRAESPPVHTYQLSPGSSPGEKLTAVKGGAGPVLLISLPQADPGFDTPRMVYLKRQYELEYYSVNQWADTPPRMVAPLLVETFSRETRWRAVALLPTSIRGDYRLDAHGLVLQQEFFQQPSRTRVSARMQLVELKDQRILGTRSFEAVEEASTEDAYGGVVAANRAVAKWLEQIMTWTTGCLSNHGNCEP